MTSITTNGFRLGAALLAMSIATVPATAAQQIRTIYSPSQLREDPGAALSRHLRTLSDSPRSVTALLGAGQAALALGDPQSALTFFARAEEVAPRDGRVKAGMGSAFVLMEQPAAALRFFGEAESFGIPASQYAKDRGLAYDLTGDPQRAQADYRLALQRADDPEVRQRLALSLAISGDREGALQTIDPLVRRQDRSAWRTRAFVLALTGDAAGATQATQQVMPAQAAAMQPFYAGLPALSPAQKAMAVHFGYFPQGAARNADAGAATYQASAPAAPTQAGRPDRNQRALGRRAPASEPASASPRRRPGAAEESAEKVGPGSRAYASRRETVPRQTLTKPARQPATNRTQPAPASATAAQPKAPAREADPRPSFSLSSLGASGIAAAPASSSPAEAQTPVSASTGNSADLKPASSAPAPSTGNSGGASAEPKPASAQTQAKPPVVYPFGPPTSGTPPRLADLKADTAAAGNVAGPPDDKPLGEAREAAPPPKKVETAKAESRKADAAKPEPKKEPKKKPAPAKPKEPSRHWVQLAGGANKATLPREFSRLKEKAPKLLAGRTAWTTPLRFTNRLLVGPFKSEAEAQDFVNALARTDVAAFSWTSPEGQAIEKLAAK